MAINLFDQRNSKEVIDATEPAHSPLGASQYDRWGKSLGGCPGSVRLAAQFPKTSSPYAEAGIRAHDTAFSILTGRPYSPLSDPEEQVAVQTYVDFIESLGDRNDKARLWSALEQKFNLSNYYPRLYGTADAVFYWYGSKKLRVVDYKHGAGIPVEVVENPQLMYYGLGALNELGMPVSSIELTIVQPRCYHKDGPIRSWTTDAVRMLEFVADLIEDAKATEDPNAALNPGDHCRWCSAQANCPAVQQKALTMAKQIFSPILDYDPVKLAATLDSLPAIESWVKSVREFAYRESEHGRVPPGWKLVDKRATRKWKEEATADHLERNLGLKAQEVTDNSVKSPAQIEKLLKTSLDHRMKMVRAHQTLNGVRQEEEAQQKIWKEFEYCFTKESSGKSLVPESDNRPQIKNDVKDVFEQIL